MIEVTKEFVKYIFPKRKENSNKGDYGKVLNIVSSDKYFGAGILASLASLKVGAGYSIFCSSSKITELFENFSPDLIYKSHNNFDINLIKDIIDSEKPSSIVLGCGISTENNVIDFVLELTEFLKNKNIITIIDADGLNCIAKSDITILNENFILTPHPKELSRLLNVNLNDIQNNREFFVKSASEKYDCPVILKGHNTLISNKDDVFINLTGNSSLAKAGTGDVLSGIIAGISAQKVTPINAAIIAVYLHGLAAEIYSDKYSEYSLLASELLNYISLAIMQVK